MQYHAKNSDSRLGQISTEFISNFNYGEGVSTHFLIKPKLVRVGCGVPGTKFSRKEKHKQLILNRNINNSS